MTQLPAIGSSIELIDTPNLIVDLDVVDANIERLFAKFRNLGAAVRPHLKTVKCPEFAHIYLKAGAKGVCVAKLAEAEVMAAGGIEDILITTEIIGAAKLKRLTELVRAHNSIKLVIDSKSGADALEEAASQAGCTLSVLIEVNVGQNRCGVEPNEEAVAIAKHIANCPHLKLSGVQGYEGHLQLLDDPAKRKELCIEAMKKLMGGVAMLRGAGFAIDVITTGGTGTSEVCAANGANEVQPGSFVFMDLAYRKAVGAAYDQALFVASTVLSKPTANRAVIDAGMKSLSTDSGNAQLDGHPEINYRPGGDEHGILESTDGQISLAIGDRVLCIPSHIDTTVNLFDYFFCHRKGKIEAIWPISARGKVQ